MKVSQLGDQLNGLGEVFSDSELTTCILKNLPPAWSSFVSIIYYSKDTLNLYELWYLCVL